MNPLPIVRFSSDVQGGHVTFANTTQGASNYKWTFGNDSTSTVANPVVHYTVNGTYRVCLTAGADCIDSLCQEIQITRVGTTEVANRVEVFLSPNPTAGLLSVEVRGQSAPYQLKVTNITGQLILQQQTDKNQLVLELDNQPNGIYFLTVETNKGDILKRFVIQK
jgi:PKD repeat protein